MSVSCTSFPGDSAVGIGLFSRIHVHAKGQNVPVITQPLTTLAQSLQSPSAHFVGVNQASSDQPFCPCSLKAFLSNSLDAITSALLISPLALQKWTIKLTKEFNVICDLAGKCKIISTNYLILQSFRLCPRLIERLPTLVS